MCYNGKNSQKQFCKRKQIYKFYRSSDCGLQFVHMKVESLVIANHHVAVNMYLDPVHTARHMPEVSFTWNIFRFIIGFL